MKDQLRLLHLILLAQWMSLRPRDHKSHGIPAGHHKPTHGTFEDNLLVKHSDVLGVNLSSTTVHHNHQTSLHVSLQLLEYRDESLYLLNGHQRKRLLRNLHINNGDQATSNNKMMSFMDDIHISPRTLRILSSTRLITTMSIKVKSSSTNNTSSPITINTRINPTQTIPNKTTLTMTTTNSNNNNHNNPLFNDVQYPNNNPINTITIKTTTTNNNNSNSNHINNHPNNTRTTQSNAK